MIYYCACDVCAKVHDLHFDDNGSNNDNGYLIITVLITLTLTDKGGGGQFSSRLIVWLPPLPNPKTNPNLDPNPNSNQGEFSLGGSCPDAEIIVYVTIKYFQQNLPKSVFHASPFSDFP